MYMEYCNCVSIDIFLSIGAVRLVNQYVYFLVPMINNVECEGDEDTLEDCPFIHTSYCYYYNGGGAFCQGTNT